MHDLHYNRILHQLASFTFLAHSQLLLCWRTKSKKSLYYSIKTLREKNFIGTLKYRFDPKAGRVEDVHYIKPKGLKYLQKHFWQQISQNKIPKQKPAFYNDYQHRKDLISIHIRLRQEIWKSTDDENNSRVVDFHSYFEKRKRPNIKRKETATKLHLSNGYIIPDAAFTIENNELRTLFLLELHNWYRVKKITQQLRQYWEVIANWIASSKYWIKSNPHVLIIFDKESTLRTTLERMVNDSYYIYLRNFYHFICLETYLNNPLHEWINLNQERHSLLNGRLAN